MESEQKSSPGKFVLFLKWLADQLNKHWIWKTIITFFPSVWLPFIIRYRGGQLGLLDGTDTLTTVGMWLTALIYLVAFALMLLSNIRSKNEELRQQSIRDKMVVAESTKRFYCNLLSSSHMVETAGSSNLIEVVYNSTTHNRRKIADTFLQSISPLQQLRNIAEEICSCFHEQTFIDKDKLIVSMAYSFEPFTAPTWRWVDSQAVHGGLPLRELTTNEKTVFYRLMTRQIGSRFVYINNKAEAKSRDQYVSDERDKKYRDVGSLVAAEVFIESAGEAMVRLILSVSSYGKKISIDEARPVLDAVEENLRAIFEQFEEQIRSELSLLYLQHCYKAAAGLE